MRNSSKRRTTIYFIFVAFFIGIMVGNPLLYGSNSAQASNNTTLNNSSFEFEGGYPTGTGVDVLAHICKNILYL
jgi:hypothetical protein